MENAGGAWESPPLPRGSREDVREGGVRAVAEHGRGSIRPKSPWTRSASLERMRIPPAGRIARPARFSKAGFAAGCRKSHSGMTSMARGGEIRSIHPSGPHLRRQGAPAMPGGGKSAERRCMSRCNPRRKIAKSAGAERQADFGWIVRTAGHPRPRCVIFALLKRRNVERLDRETGWRHFRTNGMEPIFGSNGSIRPREEIRQGVAHDRKEAREEAEAGHGRTAGEFV